MTKEFVVSLDDKPGTLANLLRSVAKHDVNLRGIEGSAVGDFDIARLITDDSDKMERALREANVAWREFEALTVRMPDRPGELLKIAEKLGSNGINIESVFNLTPTRAGEAEVALRVDDLKRARKALGL